MSQTMMDAKIALGMLTPLVIPNDPNQIALISQLHHIRHDDIVATTDRDNTLYNMQLVRHWNNQTRI
jgi:hypothetical protein